MVGGGGGGEEGGVKLDKTNTARDGKMENKNLLQSKEKTILLTVPPEEKGVDKENKGREQSGGMVAFLPSFLPPLSPPVSQGVASPPLSRIVSSPK